MRGDVLVDGMDVLRLVLFAPGCIRHQMLLVLSFVFLHCVAACWMGVMWALGSLDVWVRSVHTRKLLRFLILTSSFATYIHSNCIYITGRIRQVRDRTRADACIESRS